MIRETRVLLAREQSAERLRARWARVTHELAEARLQVLALGRENASLRAQLATLRGRVEERTGTPEVRPRRVV